MKTKKLSFCLLLLFITSLTKAQQWEFVGLNSLVIKQLYVSGDSIWAGTAIRSGANVNAGLYFSSNAGNSWVQIDSSLGVGSIVGMENLGNGSIYIIKGLSQYSLAGNIYKTTNNGFSWDNINISGYAISWVGVSPFNNNEVYALDVSFFPAGVLNYLYKSTNGGESWEDISAFPASSHGSRLTFTFDLIDSINLYVTVDDGYTLYLFKSTDKGNNWFYIGGLPVSPVETRTDLFLLGRIYLFADYKITDNVGNSWYDGDTGLINHQYYLSFYMHENLPGKIYNLRRDGLFVSNNDTISWQLIEGSEILPLNLGATGFNFGDVGQMRNIFYRDISNTIFVGTAKGIYKKNVITGVGENDYNLPSEFQLNQNFPNPFNPSTTINYSIKENGLVTLKLFDVLGKQVETLIDEEKEAGSYSIKFDASELPSGIYFYTIQSGNFSDSKKMILLK